MGDELTAAGVRQRGGDRDLDAELTRPVRLACDQSVEMRGDRGLGQQMRQVGWNEPRTKMPYQLGSRARP